MTCHAHILVLSLLLLSFRNDLKTMLVGMRVLLLSLPVLVTGYGAPVLDMFLLLLLLDGPGRA